MHVLTFPRKDHFAYHIMHSLSNPLGHPLSHSLIHLFNTFSPPFFSQRHTASYTMLARVEAEFYLWFLNILVYAGENTIPQQTY